MRWSRVLKAAGLALVVVGVAGIVAGRARIFADTDRLALWQEIQLTREGPLWLVEPQEEPTAVKAPRWRRGAHALMTRFPLPPMEGTRRGLWVRMDAGTLFYEFDDGWRTPAVGTAADVRAWAEEWPYKGWDAGLVVAGVASFVLGWLVRHGT